MDDMESHHKPLETILRKPLALAPPRLRHIILALQKYSITLIHRPGQEIPVADTLSRKSMNDTDSSLSEAMETQVHTVISAASVSADRLGQQGRHSSGRAAVHPQTGHSVRLAGDKETVSPTKSVNTGTTVTRSERLMASS